MRQNKISKSLWALILLLLISSLNLKAQENDYKVATVAFYNLENLFDTTNSEGVEDEEYTPESKKNWNTEKYNNKLKHLSYAISKIGKDLSPIPPTILGVSEVENKGVLEDLIQQPKLEPHNYGIVHYDSPGDRGIDVGLLYQKEHFTVTNSTSTPVKVEDEEDFKTRDQLVVSGVMDNERMHFIVNHWPSRYGGEKQSRPFRIAAAKVCRSLVDSLIELEDNPKIIVMGDFNDDPIDKSVKKYLNTTGKKEKVDEKTLYNPMYSMFEKGLGTLAYRDQWNLFDQLIVSKAFIEEEKNSFRLYKTNIFNKDFLIRDEGKYKGYPKRTHAGGIYLNGYSDHLPVYLYLIKKL